MYCNQCGTKNEQNALYCINDGVPLKNPYVTGIVDKGDKQYCGSCGGKNSDPAAHYCMECGASLDTYYSEKRRILNVSIHHKRGFDLELGKKVLPGVIISVVLSLVISLVVFSVLESKNTDLASAQLQSIFGLSNFIDFSLHAHMVNFSMNMFDTYEGVQSTTTISLALIGYSAIPIISLMVGGYFIKRKYASIAKTGKWKASIYFAVLYGIALGGISLFAGGELPENDMFFGTDTEVSIQFNIISALFNGVVLGFFFSYIGMAIGRGFFRYDKETIHKTTYGASLHYSIITFILGFIMLIIFNAILFSQDNISMDNMIFATLTGGSSTVTIAGAIQLVMFIFNLVIFNTFTINTPEADMSEVKYSIFSGMSEADNIQFNLSPLFTDYEIFIYVGAIAVAVLFIFVGRWLARSLTNAVKPVLVYSVLFAILFTYFTYQANYQVMSSSPDFGQQTMFMGFGVFKTFIISAVYAGVTAFIGVQTKKLF